MATTYQPTQWLIPDNANTDKVGNYSLYGDGVGADIINIEGLGITGDWSVSFWANQSSTSGVIRYPVSWASTQGVFLSYSAGSPAYSWGVFDGSSLLEGSATNTTDTWMHFVVTKSGTTYTLYKDGGADGSGTLADMGIDDVVLFERTDGIGPINGLLSEVSVFNYALTSGNVTTLYGSASAGVGNPMGLDTVPVGYWKGDRATLGAQWNVPNQVSQDYAFSYPTTIYGSCPHITCGNPVALNSTEFSVSFWMNPTVSTAWAQIITRNITLGPYTPTNQGWELMVSGTNIHFTMTGGTSTCLFAAGLMTAGTWYHITITYDLGATEGKIYLDSVLQATDSIMTIDFTDLADTDFIIGARTPNGAVSGAPIDNINAELSQVSFYNSVLSLSDVQSLYNSGTPSATTVAALSPVGYWKLDASSTFGGTNWSIPDDSTNSNTGTSGLMTQASLVPATITRGTTLYSNYSFDFDGVGDYIELASAMSTSGTDWSISFWFKSSQAGANRWMVGTTSSLGYFGISWNKLTFASSDGTFNLTSVLSVNDGVWHNGLYTYNFTSGAWTLYIDGTLDKTQTATTSVNISPLLFFGARTDALNFSDCNLSNIAYWNNDQSANKTAIYNNGRPGDLTSLSPVGWWRLGEDASWNGSVWIVSDQIGSNDGTSVGPPELVGDAPQSYANGLSVSMDVNDRLGESGQSINNGSSLNMVLDSRSTTTPA